MEVLLSRPTIQNYRKDITIMTTKDWTGNKKSIYVTLGASSHTEEEREKNDYYATPKEAVEMLLGLEEFSNKIWEPACGEGAISNVLIENGHEVYSTDLIDRGYGTGGVDFLKKTQEMLDKKQKADMDIITNPPYSLANQFVEKAMDIVTDGHKVAMFLKIQFLEGKARRKLFEKYPPKTIYVASGRLQCIKNGDTEKLKGTSYAVCYCWFVWEKGFTGNPTIKWFN